MSLQLSINNRYTINAKANQMYEFGIPKNLLNKEVTLISKCKINKGYYIVKCSIGRLHLIPSKFLK